MRTFSRRAALTALAGGTVATVAACSPARPESPGLPPAQAVVMIIRHAEKPQDSSPPFGVTAGGQQDPESLTTQGWSRSGALIGLFDPRSATGAPLAVRAGLARPAVIFASDPGDTGSKRPQQTVAAVAASLGLPTNLNFRKGDEAALAVALATSPGPVLVAWEHEKIGAILSHLGTVSPTPPPTWPDSRFDVVYVLTGSGGRWSFAQVPQMLLAADSPDPVA